VLRAIAIATLRRLRSDDDPDIEGQPRRRGGGWMALAITAPLAVVAVGSGLAIERYVVPAVVEMQLRGALADAGFPTARYRAVELGFHHVRFVGASLGDGLELGDVTVDTGLATLWGRRPERVAIHGARIAAAALAPAASHRANRVSRARPLPRLNLQLDDCELDVAGARIAIAGTIAIDPTRPIAGELAARASVIAVAGVEARGVVADVTAPGDGSVAASWHADLATTDPRVALTGARVHGTSSGDLARLAFDVTGELDAAHVRTGPARLDEVHVPFALHGAVAGGHFTLAPRGGLEIHASALELALAGGPLRATAPVLTAAAGLAWPRVLTWRAVRTCWRDACFDHPSGTLAGTRAGMRHVVRWRAISASWAGTRVSAPSGTSDLDPSWSRGVHELAWARAAGPGPLALGAGSARVRSARGYLAIARASAAALGGKLELAPVTLGARGATPIAVHVRGVALDRLLDTLGSSHVRGTGTLDGELALRLDRGGLDLAGGRLFARGAGRLELGDLGALAATAGVTSPVSRTVRERIVAALASFAYTQLSAVVQPDLAVQLTVRGRGRRVPQDLDVTVNLRGVRDAVHRFSFARFARRTP
jgi:hypothetical protein